MYVTSVTSALVMNILLLVKDLGTPSISGRKSTLVWVMKIKEGEEREESCSWGDVGPNIGEQVETRLSRSEMFTLSLDSLLSFGR